MATDTIDIWCDSDFLPEMPTVKNRTALVQALQRRLSTPRGQAQFWPSYGLNLQDYLMSKTSAPVVSSAVRGEILQDERVVQCRVGAEISPGLITLRCAVLDENGAEYDFTLSVTEAAVELV